VRRLVLGLGSLFPVVIVVIVGYFDIGFQLLLMESRRMTFSPEQEVSKTLSDDVINRVTFLIKDRGIGYNLEDVR